MKQREVTKTVVNMFKNSLCHSSLQVQNEVTSTLIKTELGEKLNFYISDSSCDTIYKFSLAIF